MPRAKVVTDSTREHFAHEGYVVIPQVVDPLLIGRALRAINSELDPAIDHSVRQSDGGLSPSLAESCEIRHLITESGALEAISALRGGAPLAAPDHAQVALRFPSRPDVAAGDVFAHIDGVHTPHNGLPNDGTLHGFTALASVLLSDLPAGGHGNFTVWPGGHRAMAARLRQRGVVIDDPEGFLVEVDELARSLTSPVPVTGRAGDLLVAHFLLPHAVGPNVSPHIRYAVFFRLTAPERSSLGDAVFTAELAEWPAPLAVAGRAGASAAS